MTKIKKLRREKYSLLISFVIRFVVSSVICVFAISHNVNV